MKFAEEQASVMCVDTYNECFSTRMDLYGIMAVCLTTADIVPADGTCELRSAMRYVNRN